MTNEIYDGHAFLIKDIKKLAKLYACVDCPARFTKPCDLPRHAKTCAQGKTVIDCPNERVEAPQTAHQRAFYGKSMCSPSSFRWLGRISKALIWEAHLSRSMWTRWREMDRRRSFYGQPANPPARQPASRGVSPVGCSEPARQSEQTVIRCITYFSSRDSSSDKIAEKSYTTHWPSLFIR